MKITVEAGQDLDLYPLDVTTFTIPNSPPIVLSRTWNEVPLSVLHAVGEVFVAMYPEREVEVLEAVGAIEYERMEQKPELEWVTTPYAKTHPAYPHKLVLRVRHPPSGHVYKSYPEYYAGRDAKHAKARILMFFPESLQEAWGYSRALCAYLKKLAQEMPV